MPRKAAEPTKKAVSKAPKKDKPMQPVINLGLVGHVDHGKTTLTERLSGKWTDTHSEELKRGITIRLGYADTTIRFCQSCKAPACFSTAKKCPSCGGQTDQIRKISIVDAPGHESLMATMLAGTTIMDGVLLLVAANETCPQAQTREHIMALQIMGIKHIIVVQNKIDLVKKEQAMKNYKEIKKFLSDTIYKDAPIIPISAQHNVNIDVLIQAIEENFETPDRDTYEEPLMFVARSFDINKPGTNPMDMIGGILGGSLTAGVLKVGDEIELRPGHRYEKGNKMIYEPLTTTITGLKTGGDNVDEITPGGSIGVMTTLDPSIVKSDALTGNLVGHKGKLPPIIEDLKLEVHLLERVVGAKDELDVDPLKMGEPLMLNVNSASTVGVITKMGKGITECKLKLAICAKPGSRVTISRRVANRFRLIGYGVIQE